MVESQVATLSAATAASNTSIPPFKSSYPVVSPTPIQAHSQLSHSGSSRQSTSSALASLPSNDRFLLVSGTTGSSLAINLEDTAGIWLNQLDLQLEDTSRASGSPYQVARPTSSAARVKLEPTPVTLSNPASVPSSTVSRPGKVAKASLGSYVPPLPYDVFLPTSTAPADTASATPQTAAGLSAVPEFPGSSPSARASFELPQVTPALLQYLPPSAAVRARYLDGLSDAMMVHPGFNFRHFEQRIDAMVAWGEANAEPPRAKSDLAREIFGSGASGGAGTSKKLVGTTSRERSPAASPKPTLSFFAAACAAFALGSIMGPDNDDDVNADATDGSTAQRSCPAALFALSKQALALFEETSSYDMDSVIAMLLQVLCLLHDGQMRISHIVFPLTAKMINVARMMGLALDPDEFPGSFSLFEAETRRRLWWDIFYYDMSVVHMASWGILNSNVAPQGCVGVHGPAVAHLGDLVLNEDPC